MNSQNFLLDSTSSANISKPLSPTKSTSTHSSYEDRPADEKSFKTQLDQAESRYSADKTQTNKASESTNDNADKGHGTAHSHAPTSKSQSPEKSGSQVTEAGDEGYDSIGHESLHSDSGEVTATAVNALSANGQSALDVTISGGKALPTDAETNVLDAANDQQSLAVPSPLSVTDPLAEQSIAPINGQLTAETSTLAQEGSVLANAVRSQSAVLSSANVSTDSLSRSQAEIKNVSDQQAVVIDSVQNTTQNQGLVKPVVAEATLLANSIAAEISPLQAASKGNMADKLFLNRLSELAATGAKSDSLVEQLAAKLSDSSNSSPLAGIVSPIANIDRVAALPQLSVGVPFQQSQWNSAVAERVMWMSSQGVKEAEIQMDPPELGPITVKVSVANEQASVSFAVQNGSVRESLDQGAVRLREMFAEEGIDLVDVDVSGQSQEDNSSEEGEELIVGNHRDGNDQDDTTLVQETAIDSSSGPYSLVDAYI